MNKENKEKVKKDVCQIKYCGRPTHKDSEYCIFHAKADEKEEKEFKETLKIYIEEIKEKDKDYDFNFFIFVGNIDFRKDLGITIFKNADFSLATFKGHVDFWQATFEGHAYFMATTFEKHTSFEEVTFGGNVYFEGAIFKEGTNFMDATFEGDVSFLVKSFEKYVNFSRASLLPGNELKLIARKKGTISFERAYLENVRLNINLGTGVLIDFTDALLGSAKIERDQIENHILQEEKKEFSQAREVYLLLKNNFHSIGRYDDESWAFEKEKEMERSIYSYGSFIKKIKKDKNISKNKKYKKAYTSVGFFLEWLFTKNFLLWIIYGFLDFLFGYGERPLRVIRFAIIIIIVSAFFYMYFGISTYPENIKLNLDISNNILTEPQEITLNTKLSGIIIKDFCNCLYFSTVTFTTLGYGDLRPLEGWSRIFAGTEAFIGAFVIALFVYTFGRRTGGR